MKQSLQLKFSQHLALTPQLQQSIRLLQLSTQELNQELESLLQANPLLERTDRPEDGGEAESFTPMPNGAETSVAAPAETPEAEAPRQDEFGGGGEDYVEISGGSNRWD